MIYWDTEFSITLSGQEKKKFLGKKSIINFLYRHGVLSGAELSNLIQLSIPTTTQYINELIEEEFIEYRGKGESIGGRKPNLYGLAKDGLFVLGIDIARKHIAISIYNSELEKINAFLTQTSGILNELRLVDEIYEQCMELCKQSNISKDKIMGIGISMPGLINSETGQSHTYLNFGEKPVAEILTQKFKLPVFIENDAKARTLAEMRYGAAKGVKNALLIQIDWGLGLGMILNGQLYRGKSGLAGEFSHIPMDSDGILCHCGKVGCLETVASAQALNRYMLQELAHNPNSILHELYCTDKNQINAIRILDAVKRGDQLAIAQIQRLGLQLGKGLAILIQVLNPEMVILSGIVAQAGDYLLTPVKQALMTYCLNEIRQNADIVVSPLGDDSGVIGAAAVVVENLLTLKPG